MIGEKISPILEKIDDALWEFKEEHPYTPLNFTTNGFRSAVSIFMLAMADKMFENLEIKNVTQEEACNQAFKLGCSLREMVLEHTGIDTYDLFSDEQTTFTKHE